MAFLNIFNKLTEKKSKKITVETNKLDLDHFYYEWIQILWLMVRPYLHFVL